jgi:SpoVK/Ycf46/Vps4 family AAA+-type ATPase
MEARTDSNIQRNAMVGVFLRLLEYYQGVLFLTSNRAKNIDKAFYSRISMAINFPGLEASDRYKIWENNLNLNDVVLTEDEIWDLSSYEVNGRQIKNVCRNAHALALRDGRTAQYSDFTLVLEKGEAFQEAVFQLGTSNTDMSFSAIAAHHEEEFEFIEPARYSSDDGFWIRLGRAVKAFFA